MPRIYSTDCMHSLHISRYSGNPTFLYFAANSTILLVMLLATLVAIIGLKVAEKSAFPRSPQEAKRQIWSGIVDHAVGAPKA